MPYLAEDDALVSARFLVVADAEPGLLPRLLTPLARRDLVPDAVHATRDGAVIRAELWLAAMPGGMVHLVAGNLGQVVGVQQVSTEHAAPLGQPDSALRDSGDGGRARVIGADPLRAAA